MCTTEQTPPGKRDTIAVRHGTGVTTMWLFVIVLLTLAVLIVLPRIWVPARENHGWMSQQWLAEYRASHPNS